MEVYHWLILLIVIAVSVAIYILRQPKRQPDITYSSIVGDTIFSASTTRGENWMSGPTVTVRDDDAETLVRRAKEGGLNVFSFLLICLAFQA